MAHPAFTGELAGTPPLTPQKVAAMTAQLGEGKTGVYWPKFPSPTTGGRMAHDASPSKTPSTLPLRTRVAGIAFR